MLMRSTRRVLWALAPCGALLLATSADANPPVYIIDTPNPQTMGQFARTVALADINGDGRADIATGAGYEDVDTNGDTIPDSVDQGRGYVFSGADGSLLQAYDRPSPHADALFAHSSRFGDVNNDGIPDVVAGAPYEDIAGFGTEAGRVYVFSGADGSLLYTFQSPHPETLGTFGGMPPAADINGDGYDDVAVSAHGEDVGGRIDEGRAYVFSGADGTLMCELNTPNPQSFAAFGVIFGVRDINGDNKAEIITAAYYEDVGGNANQGRVYVFSGAGCSGGATVSSAICTIDTPNPQAGAEFGTYVSVGLADGDAVADIVVTAIAEDVSGLINAGRVYVFSGATCSLVPGGVFDAPSGEPDTLYGFSTTVGDIDGDAQPELVIAAPEEDALGTVDLGVIRVMSLADGSTEGLIYPPYAGTKTAFGAHMAVADVTGDGVFDLAITHPGANVGSNVGQGRLYIFCLSQAEADLDGYTDCTEWHVGTDRLVRCGVGVLPQPSTAWPADLASGGIPDSTDRLNVLDLTSFLAPAPRHFGTSPGDPGYDVRWDITPGRGLFLTDINIQDLTSMLAGTTGFPPMLGGAQAFNGPPCTDA